MAWLGHTRSFFVSFVTRRIFVAPVYPSLYLAKNRYQYHIFCRKPVISESDRCRIAIISSFYTGIAPRMEYWILESYRLSFVVFFKTYLQHPALVLSRPRPADVIATPQHGGTRDDSQRPAEPPSPGE